MEGTCMEVPVILDAIQYPIVSALTVFRGRRNGASRATRDGKPDATIDESARRIQLFIRSIYKEAPSRDYETALTAIWDNTAGLCLVRPHCHCHP